MSDEPESKVHWWMFGSATEGPFISGDSFRNKKEASEATDGGLLVKAEIGMELGADWKESNVGDWVSW